MSNGSPLSREKPAQSPQIRMQARSKITVVDTLPKDVEARSIGFHGSTRDNFDSIKDMGVDFRRTGRNHEGFSMFGPGLYVTPQYGNAEDFAMRATTRDLRDNEDAEPEVAQVFVAKPDDKLVQADLPRDAKPGHPEMYEDVMRDAHLVNINHLASFITPRGAESEDVNFYVLRNQ